LWWALAAHHAMEGLREAAKRGWGSGAATGRRHWQSRHVVDKTAGCGVGLVVYALVFIGHVNRNL
jgi:hypothetical protein